MIQDHGIPPPCPLNSQPPDCWSTDIQVVHPTIEEEQEYVMSLIADGKDNLFFLFVRSNFFVAFLNAIQFLKFHSCFREEMFFCLLWLEHVSVW